MSSAAAITAGRDAAEREMTLTLTAYSPNGVTQDADGFDVPDFADEGSVRGKTQAPSTQGRDTKTSYLRIGEVERPILEAGLHIPISAAVPTAGHKGVGWEYLVTAVGQDDDPALIGRRYLVVEVPAKSKATARRLNVVEL